MVMANGPTPKPAPPFEDFPWNKVTRGLFKVCRQAGRKRPACAHVAVHYQGFWFYIDQTDQDSKATLSLLLELSRLELSAKTGTALLLTLPLGGR